mgnify:CR=1 FL=1
MKSAILLIAALSLLVVACDRPSPSVVRSKRVDAYGYYLTVSNYYHRIRSGTLSEYKVSAEAYSALSIGDSLQ